MTDGVASAADAPEPTTAATVRPSEIRIVVEPAAIKGFALLAIAGVLAAMWAHGSLGLPDIPAPDASAGLWLIFITGITAGGLSCLAVQGGLLATTIAQREQRLIELHMEDQARLSEHARPILLFLGAKLVAYTALGALLGLLGSFISLSPALRGALQIGIGVFMLGVALQMLDVHPVFRYFSLQPPKRVQRLIRKHSKGDDAVTPLTLGALTVLIPCGVTQAMELVAIGTGSPVRGALIMFAFVLGTSPLFFILGLLATRLSARMHGAFLKLAAGAVAVLAVLSIVSGYHLLPFSMIGAVPAAASAEGASVALASVGPAAIQPAGGALEQTATINVRSFGYEPKVVRIRSGVPTKLNLVSDNVHSCARAFVIPALNVQRILPSTGTETIDLPASEPGQIAFTCSMGMFTGVIEVLQ